MAASLQTHAKRDEPRFEHFQHGADIGIRGIGPTKEEAFRQAAMALTAVVTDPAGVGLKREVIIEREAPDDGILLMDWLNALIYEMSANQLIFGSFDVLLGDHHLEGRAWGEKVDVERHEPVVEVKGATFTALSVAQNSNHDWVAQCVVDV